MVMQRDEWKLLEGQGPLALDQQEQPTECPPGGAVMSNEDHTDYQPGDFPVPIGTIVEYRGRDYEIIDHQKPRKGTPDPELNYPDGVAYVVHRADKPAKLDSPGWVVQVRRRSFRVKDVPEQES